MLDFNNTIVVTDCEIDERINFIISKKIQTISNNDALKLTMNVIDFTTLEGSDTNEKVSNLCFKARKLSQQSSDISGVAAVCVYPPFVKLAKNILINTDIKVVTVSGAFPSGQSSLHIKLEEAKYAIDEGADEIDIPISRGKFLQGDYQEVFDEIAAIKNVCKNILLKVILETGELQTLTNVRRASDIAIYAGADFIKTSTGKIIPAATEQTFLVMTDAIKEYFQKTGKMIGIKPAGGISEPAHALNYIKLLEYSLGKKWMNKDMFRIGASKLVDKLLIEIFNTK